MSKGEDTSLSNVLFPYLYSNIYILSKADGGISDGGNCVGSEACDNMWVHVCEHASLITEWHMLQEAN